MFWERCGRAWSMLQAAAHEGDGKTVAVVTHSSVISGILCRCLEMGPADLSLFRTGGGSVTLIGFPGGLQLPGLRNGFGSPGMHHIDVIRHAPGCHMSMCKCCMAKLEWAVMPCDCAG